MAVPAVDGYSLSILERDDVAGADIAAVLRRAAAAAAWCAANAATIDRDEAYPEDEFRLIVETGLLLAPLRRSLGGLGLGDEPGRTLPLLHLLERLGSGNLAVGRLYEGHANALGLVQTFGTPAQIDRLGCDVRDRGRVFAVWNTEGPDGVHVVPIGGGRYRLTGAKTFASGAGHVDRPLLTGALPDGGWQMAVLPDGRAMGTVDRSWWRPLGMRPSASYKIDLSGVELGPDDLIGAPGDYYRQPWFGGGAIRFAAVQLGGAAALLDAARSELRVLGRADDPLQRARLGEAAIALEGGRLWLRGAAAMADRSALSGTAGTVDAETIVAYANMTRSAIERVCLEVLERVERAVGARGLLRPHPIERIGRDLTLYLRQPAPDAALGDVGRYALGAEAPVLDLWRPAGGFGALPAGGRERP